MINFDNLTKALSTFGDSGPFDHCYVDDFFDDKTAFELHQEFPAFDSEVWHEYSNPLEIKKTCNNWNQFPKTTYSVFETLNSHAFISRLSQSLNISPLYADPGLNGGGWHIHKAGGKLNTHLDYSMHPKLPFKRILNILIYLTPDWGQSWGGKIGFWSASVDGKKPDKLEKSIEPKFNRAVIFNTSQNSWHGLPEPITCPEGKFRRSLAAYYLTDSDLETPANQRAVFAPTEAQKDDPEILDLIEKRASVTASKDVYKK